MPIEAPQLGAPMDVVPEPGSDDGARLDRCLVGSVVVTALVLVAAGLLLMSRRRRKRGG